jgi:hypothetical protein
MPNNQEIYFGACDLQMEEFIDLAAFRRCLVLGILFQGDLAIPDIFFYITNYIPEIIKKDKLAHDFMEAAFRNNAIIPIFRSDDHTTFRQSLEEIRREQIQGVHPDADLICEFLETATRGRRLHYRLWPKSAVSVGFKQTLQRSILTDPIGSVSSSFEQFWIRTAELRAAVLSRVKPDDRGGIRRGAIMNAMHFELNKSSNLVQDMRQIWGAVQDQALANDTKKLLKWFTYAYQFNQGRMFNLSPSLASMDSIDVEFSHHLAIKATEDEVGLMWNHEFAIPSESAILTIDPKFVFDVRDSETGERYFEAVDNWQRNPSAETSNVLLDRLEKYVAELNRLYIARGRSIVNWEWHLNAYVPENKIWNKTLLEIAKDGAGELIPHFGLFSLVGPLSAATYEWWPAFARRGLRINNRVKLEVENWTKRIHKESTKTADASFK